MVWSGIYPATPGPCDLCESITDVETNLVAIPQGGCLKSMLTHGTSNLCKSCKTQGWMIFGATNVSGKVTYYNLNSQAFKHSK